MAKEPPALGQMDVALVILTILCLWAAPSACTEIDQVEDVKRHIIEVTGAPESVVWVVQLSDLHFSVHHPDRAVDFRNIVGPILSMIRPSLVLITGDLTDGKSKDLLVMKQNEKEWIEYQNVMEDVLKQSGLDKNIFYDLRGNHDNFGVPDVGGSYDFYSKYSINGQLRRNGNIRSVTVESSDRKHHFVGIDSTMSVGLGGPTNLFGHPTDELLAHLDTELSHWDFQSTKPVTKLSFGHFPLSFSASSHSGNSLKDIFLKHSISSYLCGHLHKKFGKNLKRHHQLDRHTLFSGNFQFNSHQISSKDASNCSTATLPIKEFWEWEMGDWRSSRAMRVLAIDRGHASFLDIDFKLGTKSTIIVPTFPLDSRFMLRASSPHDYKCKPTDLSSYETVRALVFSVSPVVSVVARIYDSRSGNLDLVMETDMSKGESNASRGNLYFAPWNFRAFEDPSPARYRLQIEATDIRGRSSVTEMRPFSVNGISAKHSWTWKEFFVMGCQWDALYYPILWFLLLLMMGALFISKALLIFLKKWYIYKSFSPNKGIVGGLAWVLTELCRISSVWFGLIGYLFYLVLFPWFSGHVFTAGGERAYMTYRGWAVKTSGERKSLEFIGFPDVMVVVLPHLIFVVLPTIVVVGALAAERERYRVQYLSLSGKKQDDYIPDGYGRNKKPKIYYGQRWIRNFLLMVSLAIFWKHFKSCRALMKAYEMNPLLHFPVYCISVPLLLSYAIYTTGLA